MGSTHERSTKHSQKPGRRELRNNRRPRGVKRRDAISNRIEENPMPNKKSGPRFLALVVGACLLAPPLSCAKQQQADRAPATPTSASPTWALVPNAFAKTGKHDPATIADVAERVTPSVVNISATKVEKISTPPMLNDPMLRRFFGPGFGGPGSEHPTERRAQGLGSGVIVSSDGIILTNHHVVDHAEDIKVQTSDKREFEADVVGSDAKSDLAVLRLKGKVSGLRALPLGDSSRLRLGEVVLAVGNPFGVGQTVTMGIVSAKGRADMGIADYEDFIQTDAAINPGNSGGALVNMAGQLIGINTAILSRTGGSQGIGFAIPTNMAKPIMDSLLKTGKVVRGYLGINIQDLNAELAKGLDLKGTHGVLVADVREGSPAEKAGLKRGDVVTAINGRPTETTGHLRNLVASAGANKTVKVDILRDGKHQSIDVKLGELPEEKLSMGQSHSEQSLSGLVLENLSPENRQKFEVPDEVKRGVVVTGVDPGSTASEVLRPGDVIVEINRHPISGPSDFKQAYDKASNTVLLLVYRNGSTLFLTISKH